MNKGERGYGASMLKSHFINYLLKITFKLLWIVLLLNFFLIFEFTLWDIINFIYYLLKIDNIGNYVWLDHLSVLILFFVTYSLMRHTDKGDRLLNKVSKLLICLSIILLIFAPILRLLFN
jgi:hypothetical protein